MARDEILNLEAGRDLDGLIATLAFGAKENGFFQFQDYSERQPVYKFPNTGSEILPHYSTNISDAMLVVESLRTKGAWLSFSVLPNGFTWDVRGVIDERKPSENRFIAHAETLPLAICRAFLDGFLEAA